MTLRDYQSDLYQRVRESFRKHDRVFMQLPTAGGKTPIFTTMAATSTARGWNTWIVVPRNELLDQASDSLLSAGVAHGRISASSKESAAYALHVVSKDTLIRRFRDGLVKRPPQFLIADEAHLALDQQIEIYNSLNAAAQANSMRLPLKLLGVSATPERLDGRGLSELYQDLVTGPTIVDLVEAGWLSPLRYFCPPIDGLEKVHRKGTDYLADELDALLSSRKVYGEAIEHYRRHADHKPALVYCRSVQAAEETAHRFNAAGYKFENIDGSMTYKKRKTLIDALRDGKIDGLTSCELITYGLDVPRVECVIMLRPTLSRTLWCQMIGRGMRTWQGKSELIVLDHVGNLQEHGHPLSPYTWNFAGLDKRKRERSPEIVARLCPALDFLYCDRPSCAGCEHAPDGKDPRRPLREVAGDLVEAESPVKLALRDPAERDIIEEEIGRAVAEFKKEDVLGRFADGPVQRLLEIADELGRDAMSVYWQLSAKRASVNVPLLFEIQRVKGYKNGWAYNKRKGVERRLPGRKVD